MAIKGKATKHIIEDRLDRLTLIATTIGFGQVMKEKQMEYGIRQITDTGVLVVRSDDRQTIITLWMANMTQAKEIYGDNIPVELRRAIKSNRKKFPKMFE